MLHLPLRDIDDTSAWDHREYLLIVRREYDSCTRFMNNSKEGHDHVDIFTIEVASRLISEEYVWLMDQSSCYRNFLGFSS